MKSFSPAEKSEAKMKVMNVVSGIEMRRFACLNDEFAYTNYDHSMINEGPGSNQ